MVTRMMKAWAETYPIKVYQLIGVLVAISLTWALGIYGVWQYFEREQERVCAAATEARTDIRTVILGIYNAIEADGTNELVQALRLQLDHTHPAMTFDECMEQRYGK